MNNTYDSNMSILQLEEYMKFVQQQDRIHLVFFLERPGSVGLMSSIEYLYFPPGTKENDDLTVAQMIWEELLFTVVSFPKNKLEIISQLTKTLGMRISDGTPMIVKSENGEIKISHLPGSQLENGKSNESMFTIENDKDSVVYKNNKKVNQEIKDCEYELVKAFVNGAKLTPEQIRDYIW